MPRRRPMPSLWSCLLGGDPDHIPDPRNRQIIIRLTDIRNHNDPPGGYQKCPRGHFAAVTLLILIINILRSALPLPKQKTTLSRKPQAKTLERFPKGWLPDSKAVQPPDSERKIVVFIRRSVTDGHIRRRERASNDGPEVSTTAEEVQSAPG